RIEQIHNEVYQSTPTLF
ncbi:unnamed protein product, partial [Rotaria socialis]